MKCLHHRTTTKTDAFVSVTRFWHLFPPLTFSTRPWPTMAGVGRNVTCSINRNAARLQASTALTTHVRWSRQHWRNNRMTGRGVNLTHVIQCRLLSIAALWFTRRRQEPPDSPEFVKLFPLVLSGIINWRCRICILMCAFTLRSFPG